MTVTTPNCRTCNDSGLIPAEHGCQPCPRCDAWEQHAKQGARYLMDQARNRTTESRAHVSQPSCSYCMAVAKGVASPRDGILDCPDCFARIRSCSRNVSPPHSPAVADICDRSEYIHPAYHRDDEDEEPPSDWAEVALYLVIAAIAVIAVGVAYGVVG